MKPNVGIMNSIGAKPWALNNLVSASSHSMLSSKTNNMKKTIAALLLGASATMTITAQDLTNDAWINTSSPDNLVTETGFNGRVGIGTQTPLAKLHVTDVDASEPGLLIFRDQTVPMAWPNNYVDLVDISYDYTSGSNVENNAVFIASSQGKIGLGTRTPGAYLHLERPTYTNTASWSRYLFQIESENHHHTTFGVNDRGVVHVGTPFSSSSVNSATRAEFEVWGQDNTALDLSTNYLSSFFNPAGTGRVMRLKGGWPHSSNDTPVLQVEANGDFDENILFRILANGKVAVGDETMSLPDGYRLFVEGGILTEQVRVAVKNASDWADYVFAEGYKLMPLTEVEAYVEENHHLPGIPSAEEVVESGVNMAEMDAKLLEKIEELTLHMIDMNKEMEALKRANEALQAQVAKQ